MIQQHLVRFFTTLIGITLCYSTPVYAEEDWGLCSIPTLKKTPANIVASEQPVFITADFLELKQRDAIFNGNVIFQQKPDTLITSGQLFYNADSELIKSPSTSSFTSSARKIESDSFYFEQQAQRGIFNQASLQLLESHRFSTADKIVQINEHEQQLENFLFTTCEPNDNAWALTSDSLSLNHKTGLGIAKHAKVYLFDIPIFYFPYFQFPIDDNRHSGLLMPSFALSNTSGNSLSIPVYWNIHPQMDSTIELHHNTQRGLQINTENRYLTKNTQGQLITSNLDDQQDNQQRYFYQLTQKTQLNNNLRLNLLAQKVSDQDFFSDFNVIGLSKTPDYLERHLNITHNTPQWHSTLLFQDHQILDESKSIHSRPYEQLPKLSSIGQYTVFNNTSQLKIDLSYVNFQRDDSINGERIILNPSLTRRWSNSYSFIQPQISYSLSHYNLTHLDNSNERIERDLITLSIDSGLFFERFASIENGWIQTLEPRLFYLQTPYQDQSTIPDFDTANLSSSYTNLFKTNRFTGGDRIGDTQQITLGLSTRLLSINSGLELLKISLGQTYFARDRQVQLSGTTINNTANSDLFLELSSQPNQQWQLSANITRQAETGFLTQKTIKASRQKNKHLLNLSYRFKGTEDKTDLEQTDISLVYPVNNNWSIFAKHQYSLFHKQTVEQLIGTRYDSCCWTFSVIAFGDSDKEFTQFDRTLYFQFTLKGLSSLGRNNKDLLSNSIPGY